MFGIKANVSLARITDFLLKEEINQEDLIHTKLNKTGLIVSANFNKVLNEKLLFECKNTYDFKYKMPYV
jgi:hypothetical protein